MQTNYAYYISLSNCFEYWTGRPIAVPFPFPLPPPPVSFYPFSMSVVHTQPPNWSDGCGFGAMKCEINRKQFKMAEQVWFWPGERCPVLGCTSSSFRGKLEWR